MELFLVTFGAMFSVMNPLGTVPVFVSLTSEYSKKKQSQLAFKTSLFVFIILIVSFLLGKYILVLFGISIDSLRVAGGLIIATSGFALLLGKFSAHKGMKKEKVKSDIESREDVALTPLAIPMIAGPGVISLLITYNQLYTSFNDKMIIISAMISAVFLIYIVLASSNMISNRLGASGINAISRIVGFIVIALGIEFVITAVLSFVKNYQF